MLPPISVDGDDDVLRRPRGAATQRADRALDRLVAFVRTDDLVRSERTAVRSDAERPPAAGFRLELLCLAVDARHAPGLIARCCAAPGVRVRGPAGGDRQQWPPDGERHGDRVAVGADAEL